MKRYLRIVLLTLLSLFCSVIIYAQDTIKNNVKNNIIKIYPINYAFGKEINLGYEHLFDQKTSFEIKLAWHYEDYFYSINGYLPLEYIESGGGVVYGNSWLPAKGISVNTGIKFYFNNQEQSPLGVFFNPVIMIKSSRTSNVFSDNHCTIESLNINKTVFALKTLWGAQALVFNNLTIEMYFGIGARMSNYKDEVYYQLKYESIDEGQCDENNFTEDFSTHYRKRQVFTHTFHLGINIGFAF